MTEPKPTYKTSGATTNGRQRGAVKWFNRSKGYGFILTEDGHEVFAHWQNIADEPEPGTSRKNLYDGQQVSFGVANNPNGKGQMATDIKRVR